MKRAKKPVGSIDETITTNYDNVMPLEFVRGKATTYHESFAKRMFGLAQIGLTIEQLALAFGVGMTTINNWMTKHDAFQFAYDSGKDIHDHSVQKSLLQRAQGYTYEETKHFSGVDAMGREWTRTVTSTKVVLPDVTAQIFWLKNRHPLDWRDVHRAEINSNVNMNLKSTLKLELLSPEEREMIEAVAIKQISDMNGISTD